MNDASSAAAGRSIIVTAALPPALFALANRLRQMHFPPERNHLAAHVTLFHALPPSAEGEARRLFAAIGADTAPPRARLTGVASLGRGTALAIDSPALLAIRDRIAARFAGNLTAQDSHRPRLHVTIQNKVTPAEARALQADLAPRIAPQDFAFAALEMHFYDGGPWISAGRWPFRASCHAGS